MRASRVVLWMWAVLSFSVAGSLMLGHSFALPRPASDQPALRAAIARSRGADDEGRWLALHVLYSHCRCSQRVLTHLFARGARADAAERIVLVDAPADPAQVRPVEEPDYVRAARSAGFALERIAADELPRRYHLEAAPVLVVADPQGAVRYLGGYTERKQGPDYRDGAILSALLRGDSASELPLLGCAVSRALKQTFDPLGFKERGR